MEQLTKEQIEDWYLQNDMEPPSGRDPNAKIECCKGDALEVINFADQNDDIAGQKYVPYHEVEDTLNLTPEKDDPDFRDQDINDHMYKEALSKILGELPPRQAEAIKLVKLGGLTYPAAARQMKISRQRIHVLLTKGMARLYKYVDMLPGVDLKEVI